MSRNYLLALLVTLILIALMLGAVAAQGGPETAAEPPPTMPFDTPGVQPAGAAAQRREGWAEDDSAAISFIDSPTATCYRPVAGTGNCYIQWRSMSVSASSGQYVISMTVALGDHIVAYHAGFFQTSMSIPGDMVAPGYRVNCGRPGSGGNPDLGKSYAYTIRARETGGLTAANYGSVVCPADTVRVFAPLIARRH